MAASMAERRKLIKYTDLAWNENKHLYILALEASGAFGHGLQKLMSHVSARADPSLFDASEADRTWASSHHLQYWTQRLACAFWRGSSIMFQKNAAAVRGHLQNAQRSRDEEEEDGPMPARAPVPRGGLSYYQAPPPFLSAPMSHPGARQQQHQQPPSTHHQGASHAAASEDVPPAASAAAESTRTEATARTDSGVCLAEPAAI